MAANYGDFASALLQQLGVPDTAGNRDALVTVMWAEQSGTPNANYNPFNIQAGNEPHSSVAGTGQYNFDSFAAGVQATADFLGGSNYDAIRAALRGGGDPVGVVTAWQNSPWASGHYEYRLPSILGDVQANRPKYYGATYAPAGGSSAGFMASPAGLGNTGAAAQPVDWWNPFSWNLSPGGIAGDVASQLGSVFGPILLTLAFVGGGITLVVLGVKAATGSSVLPSREEISQAAPTVAAAGSGGGAGAVAL